MKKPPGTAASCDTFVAFNRDLPFGRRWLVDFYGSLLNPKLMVFVGLARHLGKLHMVLSNPLCPSTIYDYGNLNILDVESLWLIQLKMDLWCNKQLDHNIL